MNDPFPVERLPRRIQEAVLMEFQGAHPTFLDVTSVPDAHWLKLPGMGPTTLARLRSLVEETCKQVQPSTLTRKTPDELLARHRCLLVTQRKARDQLRATKAELWRRGIVVRTE
jgi:hypothetical protein